MPSCFRNPFGSSSRRAERESDPYNSPARYGSSRGNTYGDYRLGESTNRYDAYQSSSQSRYAYEPTRTYSSGEPLRRSASTRTADSFQYDYRGISPPRTRAERPRRGNPWEYDSGSRSLSPVDESPYRSSRLQRLSSAREPRSTYADPYASSAREPRPTYDDHYASGRDSYGFTSRSAYNPDSYQAVGTNYDYNPYERPSTSGLSRSNAIRGRERPTYFPSSDGEYDPRLDAQRCPNIDIDFRKCEFNWGHY
jgi:hypothetical protein